MQAADDATRFHYVLRARLADGNELEQPLTSGRQLAVGDVFNLWLTEDGSLPPFPGFDEDESAYLHGRPWRAVALLPLPDEQFVPPHIASEGGFQGVLVVRFEQA